MPSWKDSQVMRGNCSFQNHQVFYLPYLFHFVPSMSTVTGTSPPTFIREARGLDCMLCNLASYSSELKNILECFLVNWLEEAEVHATQILWKIAATWFLCTHGSEIVKSAVKYATWGVRKGTDSHDNNTFHHSSLRVSYSFVILYEVNLLQKRIF